jgi:hypothetical protein
MALAHGVPPVRARHGARRRRAQSLRGAVREQAVAVNGRVQPAAAVGAEGGGPVRRAVAVGAADGGAVQRAVAVGAQGGRRVRKVVEVGLGRCSQSVLEHCLSFFPPKSIF